MSDRCVLPMGFSPGQVHYGFNVTKEMTVECSWVEGLYPTLFPQWQVSH